MCDRPVVVGAATYLGSMYSGPMMAPRTRQELIAACSVHGSSPFNDATIRAVQADPSTWVRQHCGASIGTLRSTASAPSAGRTCRSWLGAVGLAKLELRDDQECVIRLWRWIECNQSLIVVVPGFTAGLHADDGSEPLYDLFQDTKLLKDLPCNTATFPSQGKEQVLRADEGLVVRLRF
jgi:hypothetical protein